MHGYCSLVVWWNPDVVYRTYEFGHLCFCPCQIETTFLFFVILFFLNRSQTKLFEPPRTSDVSLVDSGLV